MKNILWRYAPPVSLPHHGPFLFPYLRRSNHNLSDLYIFKNKSLQLRSFETVRDDAKKRFIINYKVWLWTNNWEINLQPSARVAWTSFQGTPSHLPSSAGGDHCHNDHNHYDTTTHTHKITTWFMTNPYSPTSGRCLLLSKRASFARSGLPFSSSACTKQGDN